MTTETPPRPGLTRENTGYPALPYVGWYWMLEELPEIERRADQGDTGIEAPVQLASYGSEVKCKTCGETFRTGMPQQVRRCPACRNESGRKGKMA